MYVLQLTVARMAGDALTLLNNTVASTLLQSRAMLWYNSQLVVSNRDFLFYNVESDGGLKLALLISRFGATPSPSSYAHSRERTGEHQSAL